jgi:hypothetical protein
VLLVLATPYPGHHSGFFKSSSAHPFHKRKQHKRAWLHETSYKHHHTSVSFTKHNTTVSYQENKQKKTKRRSKKKGTKTKTTAQVFTKTP